MCTVARFAVLDHCCSRPNVNVHNNLYIYTMEMSESSSSSLLPRLWFFFLFSHLNVRYQLVDCIIFHIWMPCPLCVHTFNTIKKTIQCYTVQTKAKATAILHLCRAFSIHFWANRFRIEECVLSNSDWDRTCSINQQQWKTGKFHEWVRRSVATHDRREGRYGLLLFCCICSNFETIDQSMLIYIYICYHRTYSHFPAIFWKMSHSMIQMFAT